MPRKRESAVMIGGPFPVVPRKDFQMNASRAELHSIWKIIGPTVEINMRGRRPAELWEIFAVCYVQGLENGHSLAERGPTK